MPCNDITETIELQWDDNDSLLWYRLNKRTCGAEVGREALLEDLFVHAKAERILSFTPDDVRHHYPYMMQDEEFLYFKHFIAMQQALKVYLGIEASSPDGCDVVSVSSEDKGLHFVGFVAVGNLTQKIKACGHCGSCSKVR